MTREILIQRTLTALSKLPQNRANEIADFADYLLKRYDEEILQQGIQKLVSESQTFAFLKSEEDLYSINDLKERYK